MLGPGEASPTALVLFEACESWSWPHQVDRSPSAAPSKVRSTADKMGRLWPAELRPRERLRAPGGRACQAHTRLPHPCFLWSGDPALTLGPGLPRVPLPSSPWPGTRGLGWCQEAPASSSTPWAFTTLSAKWGWTDPSSFLRIHVLVAEKRLGEWSSTAPRGQPGGAGRALTSCLLPSLQHHRHSATPGQSQESTLILGHLSHCWGQPGTALRRIRLGSDGPAL